AGSPGGSSWAERITRADRPWTGSPAVRAAVARTQGPRAAATAVSPTGPEWPGCAPAPGPGGDDGSTQVRRCRCPGRDQPFGRPSAVGQSPAAGRTACGSRAARGARQPPSAGPRPKGSAAARPARGSDEVDQPTLADENPWGSSRKAFANLLAKV